MWSLHPPLLTKRMNEIRPLESLALYDQPGIFQSIPSMVYGHSFVSNPEKRAKPASISQLNGPALANCCRARKNLFKNDFMCNS